MSFDKVKAMRNAERFLSQGKIRAAIGEYKRIVENDPKDYSTLNTLGDLYVKNSESDEAVGCYTKVAEHFSKGSVVLIGKIAVDAEQKVKILENVPNIHFLGRKPYAELPAYCNAFDVALNPFEINELTLAANPLKVREYLAAGLPVVSTDIPEVRILDGCSVAADHDDFISKIEQAIAHPKLREAVSDAVAHESWEKKVEELRKVLMQRMSAQT